MTVVNPLEDYLYIRLCYSSWKRFATKVPETVQCCTNIKNSTLFFDSLEKRSIHLFYKNKLDENVQSSMVVHDLREGSPHSKLAKCFFVEESINYFHLNKNKLYNDDPCSKSIVN